MNNPEIFDKKPARVELEPGEYYWCSCGASKNQPHCDGSHKGTDFSPVSYTVEEKKEHFICNCKMSKNPPYCDGTHKSL